jgi:predicted kinase
MGRVGRAFVVMSGLPGSGKTTLGRQLATLLGLAMLDKDDVLDALLQAVGSADPPCRQSLSRASDAVLETIAANSPGAVLSSFWRRERLSTTSGTPTAWLHQLPDARLIEVHCACPPAVAAARFQARRRHSGHHDQQHTTEDLIDQFTRLDVEGPLRVGHLVAVDTSSDVDPDTVANVINRHLNP